MSNVKWIVALVVMLDMDVSGVKNTMLSSRPCTIGDLSCRWAISESEMTLPTNTRLLQCTEQIVLVNVAL